MIDFKHIEDNVLRSFEQQMRRTPQSPRWHGEGDVYMHTMMVCSALKTLLGYQCLTERQKHILNIAALLHDIGKIPTTTFIDGDWQTPHHAPTGSRMARELLWKEYGMSGEKELAQVREAICLLIRYHSFPPHAINMKGGLLRLHKIAANSALVPDFTIRMLCLLCYADMLGRQCEDQEQMLEQISFCEELAKEEGCLDGCYPFPSPVTRRMFLSGQDLWKNQLLYDETWGEVILLSGLPGTGKDTWIKKNIPELPMISLDNIRLEQKIPSRASQGVVANIAREQAKEYLRLHQPFVWNATNITTQLRESLVHLFETYHAHVRIVYLETSWQMEIERNHQREEMVPLDVLEDMLGKLVLPESYEARMVEWFYV